MFEAILSGYRWVFLQLSSFLGIGWAIVALSFICSALMLPLMKAVAGVVRREKEYEDVIFPQIKTINKMYATDMERNLHIQRLYARYGYSPLCAVKKVVPLFVQIPFLLLTYYMLKDTAEISGVKFFFLRDLGKPDALILMAGGINLLPFVMTVVNIVTVFATPGFTVKEWAQAVGVSLLFLILLYSAPSALLLYWTLNNIITMVRTLLGGGAEGARLIGSRIIALRHIPIWFWRWLTPAHCVWMSFGVVLASFYMWLMVYMEVWYFNCFVSRFLIIPTLLVAISFFILARDKRLGFKKIDCAVIALLAVLAAILMLALGLMKACPTLMAYFVRHIDFSKTYSEILGCWTFIVTAIQLCRGTNWKDFGRAYLDELHWLAVPAILAIHYSYSSETVKLPIDSMLVLAVMLIVPCVLVASVALVIFGGRMDSRKVVRISFAFCIASYLMPMISLESGKILGYGSNLVVRFLFIAFVILVALRLRKRRPVLVFFGILFVITVANAIWNATHDDFKAESNETGGKDERVESLRSVCAMRHNSVYLLIYDSYPHDQLLADVGITNSRIKEVLLPRGFTRYDSYSVGSGTIKSMSNSFAIGGVMQGSGRSMMAGNNPFCDFLSRAGYKTSYILGAYDMPGRGERMPGDFYFPAPRAVRRLEYVLYPCILRGYLSQSPNAFDSYTNEDWLAVRQKCIDSAAATNSFVYAHFSLPGHAAPNPAYRKTQDEEIHAFANRIDGADRDIAPCVDSILSKNDDSIIIVASDHGGFLKMCQVGDYGVMDLLDRCGIQLYVRWPRGYQPVLDMNCFSDVFLEVMICISGDKSLSRFETEGVSLPIQYPVKAPAGAIKNGVVCEGRDKGKRLF